MASEPRKRTEEEKALDYAKQYGWAGRIVSIMNPVTNTPFYTREDNAASTQSDRSQDESDRSSKDRKSD